MSKIGKSVLKQHRESSFIEKQLSSRESSAIKVQFLTHFFHEYGDAEDALLHTQKETGASPIQIANALKSVDRDDMAGWIYEDSFGVSKVKEKFVKRKLTEIINRIEQHQSLKGLWARRMVRR